jgi:hypothetical protein
LGRPEQKREKNHALKRENQIPTFFIEKNEHHASKILTLLIS